MNEIIILSKNIGIVTKEELKDFASALQEDTGVNVFFSTPKNLGTQVTFHDVIEIWLGIYTTYKTKLGEKVVDKILDLFWDWAKKRLSTEKKPRPKTLTIYNNEKNIIKIITIDATGKKEDTTHEGKLYPSIPPEDVEPF